MSPQYGSSDPNYWEKRIGANAGTYEDFVEGNDNLTISSLSFLPCQPQLKCTTSSKSKIC
jgi:hypothetical protein